jgi:hypothetical protein
MSAEDPLFSHVRGLHLFVVVGSSIMCRQWARRLGSEDLDRITPDQARHFLQRNRLRKQSGRSREDGQMVPGFEGLMRFFLLLRRKMMRLRRS